MTIEVQWFLEGIWWQYKVKKIHFKFQGIARRMNARVAKACNFLFPHFSRHVIVRCYEIEAVLNRQILSKNSWNLKWIFFTLHCHTPFIPFCNVLESEMNFLHFVLSSKTFWEPLIFKLHIIDPLLDVLFCLFTWFLTKKY